MLERENKFYNEHKAEYHKKYLNKWLVIVGESLWGVFDKFSDAGKSALQNFEPETEILIHRPSDDDTVIKMIGPLFLVSSKEEQEDEHEGIMTISKGEPITFQYPY